MIEEANKYYEENPVCHSAMRLWTGFSLFISTIIWLTLIGLSLQMFKGDRDGTILLAVWIFVHAAIFLSMLPLSFITSNNTLNIDEVPKRYKIYCYIMSAVNFVLSFVGIFLFINETSLIAEILIIFYIASLASLLFIALCRMCHGCCKECCDE